MEKIKIFNLSPAEMDQKFLDFLVPILKNNEVEATVENLSIEGTTWPELQKKLINAKGALLDIGTSRQIVHQIPTLPSEVRTLHCADSMFFTENKWWPRINLKEAIRALIVKKARSVDIKESAYIIGEGAVLRMLASLAAEFGFSKIYLVGLSEEDILRQMEDLKRSYIGVDWRLLEAHQLTMQTSGATLLINSLSMAENQVVMSDLAYFNFMKNQGVVVDLNVLPIENALLEEAERANLRTLSGFEVRTQQDLIFIERLGYLPLISVDAYASKWREFLVGAG
jgi:shikimate dehydrogenase